MFTFLGASCAGRDEEMPDIVVDRTVVNMVLGKDAQHRVEV